MKVRKKESVRNRLPAGSALILAVVLTSLLAIVGVLFVMVSRVDRISTSAISENKELNLAVDTVVARIARELTWDVPGVNTLEYYDYPDLNNNWLASLEPNELRIWPQVSNLASGGVPLRNLVADYVPEYQPDVRVGWPADADGDCVADSIWIELSDMTSSKGRPIFAAIRVVDDGGKLNANTGYEFDPAEIRERIDGSSQMQINLMALASQPGELPPTLLHEEDLLDARANDGVGVDPLDLLAYERNMVWSYNKPIGPYTPFDISDELELRYRFLVNHQDIDTRLEELGATGRKWGFREYAFRTPISGPGELGEWFVSAYGSAVLDPNYAYRHIATTYNMDRIIRPRGVGDANVAMANINFADANSLYRVYDAIRRGLVDGGVTPVQSVPLAAQMAVNIHDYRDDNNDVDTIQVVVPPVGVKTSYYGFERPCIYISELVCSSPPGARNQRSYAVELCNPHQDEPPVGWQLAIEGYGPNTVAIDWTGTRGFHVIRWEDPCAPLWVNWTEPNGPNPVDEGKGVDPNAILSWPAAAWAATYNVYFGTDLSDVNAGTGGTFQGNQVANTYDPGGLGFNKTYYWRVDDVNVSTRPGKVWSFTTAGPGYTPPAIQDIFGPGTWQPTEPVFVPGGLIELQRLASDGNYVVVDSNRVPNRVVMGDGTRSLQRDITKHKCIRRLWDNAPDPNSTLGYSNSFKHPNPSMIQAHPANASFTNVGEIGMVFRQPAYHLPGIDPATSTAIGYSRPPETEDGVRINLADPVFQRIFNYLTVFDPSNDFDAGSVPIDNDGDGIANETDLNLTPEFKIAGRVNINTAPWFVIAQLPWMTPELAQAVVAYRDKQQLRDSIGNVVTDYSNRMLGTGSLIPLREAPGFASVAELVNVTHNLGGMGVYNPLYDMRKYGRDNADQIMFPDLTDTDEAEDDFEERDLIFARISNLVTVRSDVFTAYILVRIGTDGPQRRVVAILDRSNVYGDVTAPSGIAGRVSVRALHPVPDPR